MASYLGKISAVVVANTSGWRKNLDAAAADTKRFAASVQRDIGKASAEANRSFASMTTPLQRLEKALQAASSFKLSFRGFDGAIRNVNDLQQRLTKLNQRQIDLVVNASGMRSISQFRQAIEGIDQKSFDFALRFGGLDGLKRVRSEVSSLSKEALGATLFAGRQPGVTNVLERLKSLRQTVDSLSGTPRQIALRVGGAETVSRLDREAIGLSKRDLSLFIKVGGRERLDQIIEEIRSVDDTSIDALVKIRGVGELDDVIEKFSSLSTEQINAVIKVLGEDGLRSATERMRALASAGRQVFEPLASATKELSSLGIEVEQAFLPGLSAVQRSAERLKASIDGIGEGTQDSRLRAEFDKAAAAAERATQGVNRLKQASGAVSGFDDGRSFRFVQPEASNVISRAQRVQQDTLSLTPSQIRQGNFAFSSGQIARELRSLEQLNARRESIFAEGPGFGVRGVQRYNQALASADSAIQAQAQKVAGLLDIWEGVVNRVTAAERASSQLNILSQADVEASLQAASQRAQALSSANGRLNVISPADVEASLQFGREQAAANQIGAGTDIAIRQLDQLGQKVVSVRGQIDSLPASIGAELVPQLKRAEAEFIRLRASGSATSEEIENAGNSVDELAAKVRRIGAAQGLGSFASGLDEAGLRGAIGSLQALQQVLLRVGATAGSEGAKQFELMRAAILRATRDGTIGSEAFQRELLEIAKNAATVAAATGRIKAGTAFRQIQRGGDIARGGFDKLSLGLQQAAFAIDDFFSATGDISQKIRAVQNNVTQLAFVVGETKGLFIGLGIAIAAQATVALIKWLNAGVEAKDRTEALNQSLARQKSLVEELKTAFESLTDSLTRGIFSDQLQEAISLGREIDEIRKKSQELRREQSGALDEEVNQERALQESLQRRLDRESDVGQRIALERQIAASRQRENDAAAAAASRQVDADEVGKAILEGINRQFAGRESDETVRVSFLPTPGIDFRDFAGDRRRADFSDQAEAERRRFEGDLNQAGGDPLELARILESRLEELASRSRELDQSVAPRQGERKAINEQIVEIERNLQDLEAPVRAAILELGLELLEGSAGIRDSLGRSREIIDSSLGGFAPLAREQDKLAQEYKRIQDELRSGLDGSGEQLTQEGIKERERELEALRKNVSGLESAARSSESFAEALDRVASNLADTVLGEAQSAEEQARRERNRRQAELDSLPADATPAERQRAERDLFNAQINDIEAGIQADQIEDGRRRIRADRRRAEEQFQRDARRGNLGADLQRDIAERDGLQRRVDSGEATANERNRLDRLEARIARSFETSAAGRDLARRSDELDQQQQRNEITRDRRRAEEEQRQQSVDRGQELLKTPQQQAAEQGLSQFDDAVNASLKNVAAELKQISPNLPELADGILSLEELGGLFSRFPLLKATLEGEFLENLQTARDNIAGNVAEQIAQFDEERSKVSRQAIQAQDVNTQQGRAELNRMLRGDDANRDKPILQGLEKQLMALKAIDDRIQSVTTVIGTAGP